MPGRFKFGAFELNLQTLELRKSGLRLRVPEQSLEILAMLVARAGGLVTREEIRELLWPNGTIVEFENSVNVAIRRLREVLSDSADTPRFIETLPRRGYRFLVPVEPLQSEGVPLHYRILGEAGRGAMGIVYEAEDIRLHRRVALKFLPDELADQPAALQRLRREAQSLAALNHPGVCTLYGIEEQGRRVCLVLEFAEGRPLSRLIDGRPLNLGQALDVAIQVAEALAAAHHAGIVHRDLKPANIVIGNDGRAKLLDFGLAVLLPGSATVSMDPTTVEGAIVGTIDYMSPEQAQGLPVDARSDIFSFGSVLYEMITGRRAFSGGAMAVSTLASILHAEPQPPSQIDTALPVELDRVIGRCLRKDPVERYQNIADVKCALKELKEEWPPPKIGSIAVLPLENLSRDPEQEYFADGMTAELITTLGKVAALRVISRTSVMQYKRTNKPLPQIAKELNADAVIEGAVLRVGARVRITANLVHAPTDRHLWAESFERDLRDVLALQGEVARAIAGEVACAIAPQKLARLVSRVRVDPEAYDLYLRGKMFQDSDNNAAMEVLERAVAIDPDFAPAYAALAGVYWVRLLFFEPKDQWREKAQAAVGRALSLDPNLAEAHVARAALLLTQTDGWQHEKAIQECQRALMLAPNLAEGHVMLARIFDHVGLLDEALHELQTATGINPTQPDAAYFTGLTLFWGGRFQDALPFLSAGWNSLLAGTKSMQPMALWALGRKQEAWVQTRELLKTDPQENDVVLATVHTLLLIDAGEGQVAEKRIEKKILAQSEKSRPYGHFHHVANCVADIYARLNKPEQAMAWLEETVATGFPCYPYFERDRALDPIRQHPRFIAFMQKLKPRWEYFKARYGSSDAGVQARAGGTA